MEWLYTVRVTPQAQMPTSTKVQLLIHVVVIGLQQPENIITTSHQNKMEFASLVSQTLLVSLTLQSLAS